MITAAEARERAMKVVIERHGIFKTLEKHATDGKFSYTGEIAGTVYERNAIIDYLREKGGYTITEEKQEQDYGSKTIYTISW